MTIVNLTPAQIASGLIETGFFLGASQFTFSHPQAGAAWAGYGAGSEPFSANYATLSVAEFGAFTDAIALWDRLIAPDFTQVSDSASTPGEVRVAYTAVPQGVGGYAYSGTPRPPGTQTGDIWLNPSASGSDYTPGNTNGSFTTLIHEIGHVLGLKHPFETPILPTAFDNTRFTVMSYSDPGAIVTFTGGSNFINSTIGVVMPITPMVVDIAAVQAIYGAETSTAAGDDSYTFDQNAAVVQSIYDAGGNDSFDFSAFSRPVLLDLTPGAYSSIGQFSASDQIAFWTSQFGVFASFIAGTINAQTNLFTWTDNLGIALTTTIENATGGSAADRLSGNSAANSLAGGAGNDMLIGLVGNDTLDGGSGLDSLFGGSGDDLFRVDSQGDLVFEDAGNGVDIVEATTGFYLYANIEQLLLVQGRTGNDFFGVGNDLANTITGNSGANLLIGHAGNDTIAGGNGNDALFGLADDDSIQGGSGIDYIVGGSGNDLLNGDDDADAVYGEDGNDVLVGGTTFSTDILVGGTGNDTIYGNSTLGDYDVLNGAAGDDIYFVDTPDDLIFEGAEEGLDFVVADIVGAGYYLYPHVENLWLMGTTPFGVGNDLANDILGSQTTNWLLGGGGDDTLDGRGGNDVLFGEAGADTFLFLPGTGGDVIGDFQPGVDRIAIGAFGFDSYDELATRLVENNGTSAIILGNGDFIVINGITNAQLGAGDFDFGGQASSGSITKVNPGVLVLSGTISGSGGWAMPPADPPLLG